MTRGEPDWITGAWDAEDEAAAREYWAQEPRYDLDKKSWDKTCPCIRAEQRDPECPWHGRPELREVP